MMDSSTANRPCEFCGHEVSVTYRVTAEKVEPTGTTLQSQQQLCPGCYWQVVLATSLVWQNILGQEIEQLRQELARVEI